MFTVTANTLTEAGEFVHFTRC